MLLTRRVRTRDFTVCRNQGLVYLMSFTSSLKTITACFTSRMSHRNLSLCINIILFDLDKHFYVVKNKEVFRACNVLPFSCTHLGKVKDPRYMQNKKDSRISFFKKVPNYLVVVLRSWFHSTGGEHGIIALPPWSGLAKNRTSKNKHPYHVEE